ncbi:hypothetical protein K504DRAFT_457904 [Pleomassaria siparia CBS 279.74]|uniref:1-alkyl-2-acetylglycerophosphocholine esterase n=1 Tax=Pleomassaria siparia CBS 279.74 TaxID=1314801 RepID=A0A6G1KS97_9PLEO|nr:hypothetical protein K504DRAFT_457904 [Pleomassaria siparia CBS 279.74]
MVSMPMLLFFLVGLIQASVVRLPSPVTEKNYYHETMVTHLDLTDPNTPDDLNPALNRKMQISLFYPILGSWCSVTCGFPYMPAVASSFTSKQFLGANNTYFDSFEFTACCAAPDHKHDPGKVPLLILDPAVGTSRHVYGILAQRIASGGTAVVTIDHPHDTSVIQFENGDTVQGSVQLNPFVAINPWNATVDNALTARTADIKYVLSQLAVVDVVKKLLPSLNVQHAFKTDSFGIAGHGLGGTVATYFGVSDNRTAVSINIDGTPPLLTQNTTKNFVFFGRDPGARREDDIHWNSTWNHIFGQKTAYNLQKGDVFDFTDLPYLNTKLVDPHSGQMKGLGEIGVNGTTATAAMVAAYMKQQFSNPQDLGLRALTEALQDWPGLLPLGQNS